MTELSVLAQPYEKDTSALGPIERFFVDVSRIDRFSERLHLLHLHVWFPEEHSELARMVNECSQAARALRGNKKFEKVLHVILSLGNALNDGTSHVAAGFKMDSLIKLGETYGADKKTSLLCYLVSTLKGKMPELLDACDGLASVQSVSDRIDLATIRPRVESLREAVQGAITEVDVASGEKWKEFRKVLNTSMRQADKQLRVLEESLSACAVHLRALC